MNPSINIEEIIKNKHQRAVFRELLELADAFSKSNVDFVLCGGWVPPLKEISRQIKPKHRFSFDIDPYFYLDRSAYQKADQIRDVIFHQRSFRHQEPRTFKLEKMVDGISIELDLLSGFPRVKDSNGTVRAPKMIGLDYSILDGWEVLENHTETVQFDYNRPDGNIGQSRITIPDAVGFLTLKALVTNYREREKDPYDLYYYCKYAEEPKTINSMLRDAQNEPIVKKALVRLKQMFQYSDSRYIDWILDFLGIKGAERDRQARGVVSIFAKVLEGIDFP